jgi:SAM-dependent methyltransferase
MLRKLHEKGWDVADALLTGLMCTGYQLTEGSKVLDYGCGTGWLVYRWRDLGFQAYGFDIHDLVNYRDPADREFFGFMPNPQPDTSNMVINWESFRIPFEDNSFDLVFSTSVLEHVLEPALVMGEIARVLRPDGCGLHLYPGRNSIIEPHMYVPFASRIQNWWWFYLWASLGVRNPYQLGMPAREVANRNTRYCRTGVRYLTDDEMYARCARHFRIVHWVDDLYYATTNPKHVRQAVWKAIKSEHPLWNLAAIPSLRVLLTERKL